MFLPMFIFSFISFNRIYQKVIKVFNEIFRNVGKGPKNRLVVIWWLFRDFYEIGEHLYLPFPLISSSKVLYTLY